MLFRSHMAIAADLLGDAGDVGGEKQALRRQTLGQDGLDVEDQDAVLEPGVAQVERALNSPVPEVRKLAFETLERRAKKGTIAHLVLALRSEHDDLRLSVLEQLSKRRDDKTVGDALVAQVPGLLISVAAAMVVSRVGAEHDISGQIMRQMFASPLVLGITSTMLIVLGLIRGMPHFVFIPIGAAIGYAAWFTSRKPAESKESDSSSPAADDGEAGWTGRRGVGRGH